MDSPEVLLKPEALAEAAHIVRAANIVMADLIGIARASRTTTVKPEGTTAALAFLESVATGDLNDMGTIMTLCA